MTELASFDASFESKTFNIDTGTKASVVINKKKVDPTRPISLVV